MILFSTFFISQLRGYNVFFILCFPESDMLLNFIFNFSKLDFYLIFIATYSAYQSTTVRGKNTDKKY